MATSFFADLLSVSSMIQQPLYWWIFMITIHIGPLSLITLCTIHCKNAFLDLFTTERKSIQWRRIKPTINATYKVTAICVCSSLILFTLSGIQALNQWSYFSKYCRLIHIISTFCYLIAKQFMYLVFLLRLQIVYNGSYFEYNKYKLISVAIITSILNVINCVLTIFFLVINQYIYTDYNMSFAMHCSAIFPIYISGVVGLQDTIICISFLLSFIIPIKALINKRNKTDKQCAENQNKELLYIGIKTFNLTLFATSSTLIFLTSLLLTNSLILSPIDININCICIILTTPYYPDNRYYNKICFLCNTCYNKLVNKNNENNKKERTPSISAIDLNDIDDDFTSNINDLNLISVPSSTLTTDSNNNGPTVSLSDLVVDVDNNTHFID